MKKIVFIIIVLISLQIKAQTKVWFDTDIMIGMPDAAAREVDDGITLIMALKQPQIQIVGISNITYVDYGYGVINKILNWHNKGAAIPVYKGSAFANDLGTENDGTRALYQALKKEKLTILALGPMTNIATLVKNHPDIIPQIEKIAICAARTPGLPFNPGNGKLNVFDYNYEFDTASMDVLLNSTIPLEFAGYEPSSYTHIGNIDLASLDLTLEADKWLFDIVQPWMELNEKYFGVRGFIPFDCSTLGIVTHPEYFTYYENIPIKVTYKKNDALEIQPDKPFKNFLEVSYKFKTKKKVKYARRALQGFEEKILETLSAAR
ncbi:nucleoside hydrolase [Flavobacterium chilense]|uniref:Pyrimidine-specific ribonucleoside hydrolase n=1 Tax=Flavobacterium chilense TaxID=946677 RepID=A0A1M7MFW4_9FLAO|nr:nucleoside hydrolase [Flavobacterium chilense]SHM89273.1 pyrimidine-specific ribonucleoside hydrolase [Flavobacterium chilense]